MCVYKGTLIAVKNMEESKRFYQDILGMRVTGDFGANVRLEGGVFLQMLDTWEGFINSREVYLKNHAVELYFEVSDIDAFYKRIQTEGIELVHELLEHRWGQKVVRFYDPNHHVIEVGEEMSMVVKRFLRGGMTVEQAAKRMDISIDDIKEYLEH